MDVFIMLTLVIIPQWVCISIALYILIYSILFVNYSSKKLDQKEKDIAISCVPGLWEKRIGFALALLWQSYVAMF